MWFKDIMSCYSSRCSNTFLASVAKTSQKRAVMIDRKNNANTGRVLNFRDYTLLKVAHLLHCVYKLVYKALNSTLNQSYLTCY